MKIIFKFISLLLLFQLLLWGGYPSRSAEANVGAFSPGERLHYKLRWGIIPVGEVIMEVQPQERLNGETVNHFVLEAKTYPFIDNFYKVRDRVDAYTDTQMRRSVLYLQKQLEGSTHRDITVHFDWDNMTAVYSNFGETLAPIKVLPGTMDPLSVFYHARHQGFSINEIMERPVTDGKKCVIGKLEVAEKETVTVQSGTFKTLRLVPDAKHIGGVFKQSDDAKVEVWVSDDHRRIPVKIKSKVIVGSFVAELISAAGLTEGGTRMNDLY